MLIDAGPLVALIDAGEADHAQCVATLDEVGLPLETSWPAFTEAIYLLGRAGGWPAQAALWRMVESEALELATPDDQTVTRSAALMRKYADHPMDLADATLVALAEQRGRREIFSLDAHFRSYRLRTGHHLRVVPA